MQNFSIAARLMLTSDPSTKLHLRLSADSKAAASDRAGIDVVLRKWTKATLLEQIPVDNRKRTMRHGGSRKWNTRRPDGRNLSVA